MAVRDAEPQPEPPKPPTKKPKPLKDLRKRKVAS